jgi:peroxiredoxin
LTNLFLFSCNGSEKAETEKFTEIINESSQSEFRKVESENGLNLEYQLLGENDEQINLASLKKMPEFPGGYESLLSFVLEEFSVDQGCIENVDGIIKATFVVDTIGNVVDIEITEGLRNPIDKSLYDVISKFPSWRPAELTNNKKIKVKFLMSIKIVSED